MADFTPHPQPEAPPWECVYSDPNTDAWWEREGR